MKPWDAYTQAAANTLVKLQRHEISMAEACRFFEDNSVVLADGEALASILNAISEIDGFPRWYSELSAFFAGQPARDALVAWLKG